MASRFWVCNIDHPSKDCRACVHFYPHVQQVVCNPKNPFEKDFCNDSHKCHEQSRQIVCCIPVEDKC
jgi:hypothetical protein